VRGNLRERSARRGSALARERQGSRAISSGRGRRRAARGRPPHLRLRFFRRSRSARAESGRFRFFMGCERELSSRSAAGIRRGAVGRRFWAAARGGRTRASQTGEHVRQTFSARRFGPRAMRIRRVTVTLSSAGAVKRGDVLCSQPSSTCRCVPSTRPSYGRKATMTYLRAS
jgi:hypothetical protein